VADLPGVDLPDVNVLMALALPRHVHHRRARAWWRRTDGFALTPFTETVLLRLLLTPAVAGEQLTFAAAHQVAESIAADPRARFLPDDASWLDADLGSVAIRGAKQITDVHLVLLARRHGLRLVTLDARVTHAFGPDAGEFAAVI
jgi:toxin-antitoxin system PIN domain toxin